jgi:hypothetical protein
MRNAKTKLLAKSKSLLTKILRCNKIMYWRFFMKKTLITMFFPIIVFYGCLSTPLNTGQNQGGLGDTFVFGEFKIPANAELLESTEFKNDGVPYLIEQRYRLPSGQIMYAYYDVDGDNSVTIQKIEEVPLLALGTDVNIPGMPGYREFNFREDRRKLVQFMKLFKLGQKDYRGNVRTPSLGDSIFTPSSVYRNEFKLLLDLYDETWVLEHYKHGSYNDVSISATAIFHTNRYID